MWNEHEFDFLKIHVPPFEKVRKQEAGYTHCAERSFDVTQNIKNHISLKTQGRCGRFSSMQIKSELQIQGCHGNLQTWHTVEQ